MKLKKIISPKSVMIVLLILTGTLCLTSPVGAVTNNEETTMIAPIPTPIPSKTMALTVEDGTEKYYLKDTQQYLSYWNTRMGWGFSNETVINYAEDLNNYLENTFEKDA
ncbi:MAG: hypothetical protein O0X93_06780, partial [Methanocorpusculum sp.]|nr:hypothetical protein [Methanocorpusculum sp.]